MRAKLTLFAAHLFGNAALLGLGYYWLGLDESDAKHLAWSALIVLLLVVGTTALHAVTLAHFSGIGLRESARKGARNLLPLLVLALFAAGLYGGLNWISGSFYKAAYVMSSSAAVAAHKAISPSISERGLKGLLCILQWMVVPAILLPLASAIAVDGWRGWKSRFWPSGKRWLYWLAVAALLLCAFWLPFKLFFWVPKLAAFGGQVASLAVRGGIGYLLFVTALFALDFLTSSGRPRSTQPSTVASP